MTQLQPKQLIGLLNYNQATMNQKIKILYSPKIDFLNKNMIHPKTALKFISNEIGFGLVATDFIPMGTITWVLDEFDMEFTPKDFESMDSIHQDIIDTYAFRSNIGNHILCWDLGRYINHSFNPTCLTTAYDFEVAVRDIHPGEQLTNDYGYFNIKQPFVGIDEGTKRKIAYPDDLLKYHEIWDHQILSAFEHINSNKQPLKELISDELWHKLNNIITGKEKMDSILENYYDEKMHKTL